MSITPEDAAAPDFDIFDWIATGTVAQRSVVIYNDPELVGEYEQLERELAAAQADDKANPEESLDETAATTRILERMAELHAKFQASKATWWVRALSDEEVKNVARLFPEPVRPDLPAELPAEERAAKAEAYRSALAAVKGEQNLHLVAAAVLRVETPKGTATSVPVEALRAMKAKPHGLARLNLLLNAVTDATNNDVEIAAPKSLGSSKGSQA